MKRIRLAKFGITAQLLGLVAAAIVPLGIALIINAFPLLERQLVSGHEDTVERGVETVAVVLDHYDEQVRRGELTLDEAQRRATAFLRDLRFDGGGYVWANDEEARMLVHPAQPELEGRDLSGQRDVNGKAYVREMVEVARRGGGFVDYMWDENGQREARLKRAYVHPFEPWGWVIGSGVNLDDIDAALVEERAGILSSLGLVLLLVAGLSVVLVQRIRRPLRSLEEATRRAAEGDLEVEVAVERDDEIGHLASSFKHMVQLIRRRMDILDGIMDTAVAMGGRGSVADALNELLTTAHGLVGARYAALSVFDKDGEIDTFLTLGMKQGIAHPPVGKGLLGRVQHHGETMRMDDMAQHPSAVGFPDGHPPMKSLLATPIEYEGTVLGNLYLSDRMEGDEPFTDEEEALITKLARLAAVSIHARQVQEEQEAMRRRLETDTEVLSDVLGRVAEGDLTVTVPADARDDAMARLKRDVGRTIGRLRELIDRITEAVDETAAASSQIGTTTEQLAAGVHEQSAQAEEVAAAVEQMARTVTENAHSTRQTSEAVGRNSTAARDGGAVVEQTVEQIREIADVVVASADRVEHLGERGRQIGEIVETISEIADQTNLLALNAAIEAARAGEQGRGFAVVADEVRKLAERTAEATQEIADMIKQVQADTQEAVKSMRAGTARVERGIALADETSEALARIVGESGGIEHMMEQIAAATEEQSVSSEQMARNVQSIASVSRESAVGVTQIAEAADGLNRLTVQLQGLADQFQVDRDASPASQANSRAVAEASYHELRFN